MACSATTSGRHAPEVGCQADAFRQVLRAEEKQDQRMVVILNEEAYGAWLDAPAYRSAEFLKP
jgi:hypothetical protein